jgi:hypothetical protein
MRRGVFIEKRDKEDEMNRDLPLLLHHALDYLSPQHPTLECLHYQPYPTKYRWLFEYGPIRHPSLGKWFQRGDSTKYLFGKERMRLCS